MPPFQINKAVDELLKREFDTYRAKGKPHPWMVEHQIKAVPMKHDSLNQWRHNFTGVATLHEPSNLLIFGAIDDIWLDSQGSVHVVDYKATAKTGEVSLDADWQISYKRQMEIYQWLLRQNDLNVSDTAYFVYTNGRLDLDGFFDKIEFRTKIIAYKGDDSWLEPAIIKIKQVMDGEMPEVGTAAMGGPCEYCTYAKARTQLTIGHINGSNSEKKSPKRAQRALKI